VTRVKISGIFGVLWPAAFVLLVLGVDSTRLDSAEPAKVALLPLRMNAEKEMRYLRDGIYEMLSARLFVAGALDPLSRQAVLRLIPSAPVQLTQASARDLGRRLGADYLVAGSATAIGQDISVDLRIVDVAGRRPVKVFFEQAGDTTEIIPCLDRLAGAMKRWVLEAPSDRAADDSRTPAVTGSLTGVP
jgi:TolB-like protein